MLISPLTVIANVPVSDNEFNSGDTYDFSLIDISWPVSAEPLKLLKQEIIRLRGLHPTSMIFLVLSMVGRRIVCRENIHLLGGRRHRIYYALSKPTGKPRICFGWHKLKRFSLQELNEVREQWHQLYFLQKGKKFIHRSGGVVFPEALFLCSLF
jgi:hypothetical protein